MKTFFRNIVRRILTWEAKAVLKKYRPKIVTVTGSVGKTSAKEAIYTVLNSSFPTRKSEKNFNRDLGILLTILGAQSGRSTVYVWVKHILEGFFLLLLPFSYPTFLVLEIAADSDRQNHIAELSSWLRTNTAVFTSFAKVPAHIEFFKTREKLLGEKLSLVSALKEDGTLVLNHDQPEFLALKEGPKHRAITFGFNEASDVKASAPSIIYGTSENSEISFPLGISFTISHLNSEYSYALNNTIGRQHVYPVLAAFVVGLSQNISPAMISTALAGHVPPRGRMSLLPGIKNTMLIDDTYNASPLAVQEGLRAFDELMVPERKIVVLGDMMYEIKKIYST
jgi:UDP-N-acetylmuramoyl-tripeptide--D-alanyl-D-alanine ligase